MIDDGFAESMDFSRMEAISTLLADDLLQHDWLPDNVYSSPGYNNYLQKRERMHILNITEVNSLLPLLIEMEK